MKPVPYQQRYRRPWGLAGELCAAPANVEVADCTRNRIARHELHSRRVWRGFVALPLCVLGTLPLVHGLHWLLLTNFARPFPDWLAGPVVIASILPPLAWILVHAVRSAMCPWCGVQLCDQPRSPAAPHCSRCHQPLTLKAWDARVPGENTGGAVPR